MMIFNLSSHQFQIVKMRLQAMDIAVPDSSSGEITGRGITVKYSYSEPTLTVTVTNYGSVPRFFVDHTIRGWFSHIDA